ncbi:hypothetical protein [Comamonas resistens]|uniref:Uncharacterized protein n=1 Tax=Comamonas resistens TaxID=3046670 RepID=A0ABY8SMY1_9BURK|nr:hypothetical protein [Comamonas resistens]MDL5037687.1 hypothetical protein [Comamonas resistens]WHS64278.1 hypothetical protein QMY55_17470 [Comamonas resistens]
MTLDYLEFDYSEDEEGTGTWDAMASVRAERVPALAAEIAELLRWALRQFAGRQGAVEEGMDWDYDLQSQDDEGRPLPARFDAVSGQLTLQASATGYATVSLSLSGSARFGDALREAFGLDD